MKNCSELYGTRCLLCKIVLCYLFDRNINVDSMRVAMNSLDGIMKVDIKLVGDFLSGIGGGLGSAATKATSKKQESFD